jgi:hypothetical protein
LRLTSSAIPILFFGATVVGAASAQSPAQTSAGAGKTFIDYFQPTPIVSPLSTTAWIHGPDGKYHIFASR